MGMHGRSRVDNTGNDVIALHVHSVLTLPLEHVQRCNFTHPGNTFWDYYFT